MEDAKIQKLLKHHAEDIIIVTDKYGCIIWANDWFTQLTEYSFDEVKGKKPGSFLQGKESNQATVRKMRTAIALEQKFNVNIVNYSKTGKKYWLNISCTPVFDSDGELACFVAIERDITSEYQRNQQKLNRLIEEQQRLSNEKSQLIELISIVAHDLKAPLNNIEGLLNMIDIENKDIANLLYHEINRSKDLIKKILLNGNNESSQVQLEISWFNLFDLIQKLSDANKNRIDLGNLSINIDCPASTQLHSDKVLFTQIMENLLVNAIKYAKEATQIDFTVSENQDVILITLSNETDSLEDWQLDKLFKPFQNFNTQFTDQSKGMGLYIVKKYLDIIGGDINVSKEDDRVFFKIALQNTSPKD